MENLLIIPDYNNFASFLKLAEQYDACFEYNDFYDTTLLDDEKKCQERIAFYQSAGRNTGRDTIHGAFLDVTVHSDDSLIREISERRVRQSMEVAKAMGVRGVIFHTGTIPNFRESFYEDHWVERNRQFFTEICGEYGGIEVYMENMFDIQPVLLARLGEAMQEVNNFGVCLDYAHATIFGGEPSEWLTSLAPYIRHIHINDNDGVHDLHDAVGDGIIDWQRFDRKVRKTGLSPTVLIETRSLDKQKKSLEFMKEHSIYPFQKERGDR